MIDTNVRSDEFTNQNSNTSYTARSSVAQLSWRVAHHRATARGVGLPSKIKTNLNEILCLYGDKNVNCSLLGYGRGDLTSGGTTSFSENTLLQGVVNVRINAFNRCFDESLWRNEEKEIKSICSWVRPALCRNKVAILSKIWDLSLERGRVRPYVRGSLQQRWRTHHSNYITVITPLMASVPS